MRTTQTTSSILGASALLWIGAASPLFAYPPAGDERFDSAATVRVTVAQAGLADEMVTLAGPVRFRRGDAYDPGNGRIQFDTEIVSMMLQGESSAGPVIVRAIPPSAGGVQQQEAGVDFPARSFFDLRLEIVVRTASGDIRAYSDPNAPIRVTATIQGLPSFDAAYQTALDFTGVDLIERGGPPVGGISRMGFFVGQQPTFSVAPSGASNLPPSDLFKRATSLGIPASSIGLGAADNVDGLSYGFDFIFPPLQSESGKIRPAIMDFRFSVAEGARGRPGSHVEREASKSPPQAHGDEFRTTPFAGLGGGSNVQMLDEDGDTAPAFPLQLGDDVDAITEQPPSYADADGDGDPQGSVYFSLSAGSPGLGASSPADILVSRAGGPPAVYIPAAQLGLTPEDDIDAFCLNTLSRSVVFSLAPGSPSLAGGSAADLFLSFQSPGSFFPVARAANLGLDPGDDVDALKCHVGESVSYFDTSLQVQMTRDGQLFKEIEYACKASKVAGAFHGFRGPPVSTEKIAGLLEELECRERDAEEGSTLRSLVGFVEAEFVDGVLEELLVEMFLEVATEETGALQALIPMIGDGPHEPLSIPSEVVVSLNAEGAPSQAGGPIPLVTPDGSPTPFAISAMTLTLDTRPRAEFNAEQFLDGAGFGETPAPGGLATLFVGTPTQEGAANAIPLPRRLGSDVQVLFEVPGEAPGQAARIPAPLLFANGNQINLQIPWEVSAAGGQVNAVVRVNGVGSEATPLSIAPTAPGLFTADFGAGRAIAVNPDGTLAQPQGSLGASRPAAIGETIVLYASGLGETNPPGITGEDSLEDDGSFVRRDVTAPVRVLIGGVEATVVFAGLSPQFVGVYQLNVTVPPGLEPGDAVSIVVEAGGRSSRGDVTIAVAAP